MTDQEYFDRFFEEKELPLESWTIERDDWVHINDSDAVIEAIKMAPAHEQSGIREVLVRIDFVNGDVMPFLEHLANGLVQNWPQ